MDNRVTSVAEEIIHARLEASAKLLNDLRDAVEALSPATLIPAELDAVETILFRGKQALRGLDAAIDFTAGSTQ